MTRTLATENALVSAPRAMVRPWLGSALAAEHKREEGGRS